MQVVRVAVSLVKVPIERPYVAGGREVSALFYVLARVTTADGVEGFGYIFMMQGDLIESLFSATRELGTLLVGRDVLQPESAWEHLSEYGRWLGPGGLLHHAIAPLDIAMWDALGKTQARPLYRLWGGDRNRIPAYASGGLWYNLPLAELAETARSYRDYGFKGIKLRAGRDTDPADEMRRIAVAREAVGPDVQIMVDAAEGWDVGRSLQIGQLYQEAGVAWLEDPLPHLDFAGLATVAQRLDVPIAAGENLYYAHDFQRLLQMGGADVAIIDLGRIGGVTPWRRAAAIAQTHGTLVCGHILPEFHIHLLGAAPNGHLIEHHFGRGELLQAMPALEDGDVVAPPGPGFGLALNEEVVRRHTIA